ncbi:MAG: class I SAM-dependent methyltransferase [Planctomycetes bacterium]|nr:class I SAM-dependent methyltransferase [Planctomycetota bacterium]
MSDRKQHWDEVYASKSVDKLGWYRPTLDVSLAWIRELELPKDAKILDVGAGASTLIDNLIADGFTGVTVLDISSAAIEIMKSRFAENSASVEFIEADVTEIDLGLDAFDLWHDRAVLHFLIEEQDARKYVGTLENAVKPGGAAIIGVFAPEAPPTCSGLPVRRYDENSIRLLLDVGFELVKQERQLHVTPGGREQMYLWSLFRHR